MSLTLVDELHEALDELATTEDARVLVLTGAGAASAPGSTWSTCRPPAPRRARAADGCSAGMDLQQRIATLVPKLRGLRIPVIAAVNGAAAGGGLALALAVGRPDRGAARPRFNVAFVRIGLSGCDIGVSWLLPRWIGASRAFELLLTGGSSTSDEADRIGLVTRVVDDEALMDAALTTARQICANSPTGVWMTKEVMWSQLEVGSLPGRHRPGEPHADHDVVHRGHGRGGRRVPREAAARRTATADARAAPPAPHGVAASDAARRTRTA